MSQIITSLVVGYLIGSIPTAYLFVRAYSNADIRQIGSGNVGAANVYRVTGSRSVSVFVAIVDILKGIVAIHIGQFISGGEFWGWALGGIAAVVGHNFPIWLKFRGGRGLATACGVTITWAFLLPVLWMASWAIGKKIFRDTIFGNMFATLLVLVFAIVIREEWVQQFTFMEVTKFNFQIFSILLALTILTKHFMPFVSKVRDRLKYER